MIIVRILFFQIKNLVNRFTYDDINKSSKDNIFNGQIRENKNNTFSKIKKAPKNKKNINLFKQNNNKIYKTNSYIGRIKNNFNTSCNNNTNRELKNFFGEYNTNTNHISNKDNKINMDMDININDEQNNIIFYENKISKLETEINELRLNKEKIQENLSFFLALIKKYSNKLLSLANNSTNDPIIYKEIKLNIFNLSKTLNNPKLSEDLFLSPGNDKFFSSEDFINLENNNNNAPFNSNSNRNKNDKLEEYKNGVEEIISKYEKKIDLLKKENEDISIKINTLKNENESLKEELDEEKKIKETIIDNLNKLKEENNELEKKNKILDYKCTSYFNRSTQSKYEQKNIEEEIDYKNKIIKYLDNLLKNTSYKVNEDICKKNIHKIFDLKRNLKEVINGKKVYNDEINKENSHSRNTIEKSKLIENGSSYINEKTNSSISCKSNNNKKLQNEIDALDEEIAQIESKLETMIKEQ